MSVKFVLHLARIGSTKTKQNKTKKKKKELGKAMKSDTNNSREIITWAT